MTFLANTFTLGRRVATGTRLFTFVLVSSIGLAHSASAQSFDDLRDELMKIFNWDVAAGSRDDNILGARLTIDDSCGMSSQQLLDNTSVPQTMSFTESLGNLRYVDPTRIEFSNYGGGVAGVSMHIADGGQNWTGGGIVLVNDRFFQTVLDEIETGAVLGTCNAEGCAFSRSAPIDFILSAPNSADGREQDIVDLITALIEHCPTLSTEDG